MSLTPFAFWPLQSYSALRNPLAWDIEVYRVTTTYRARRALDFPTEAEAAAYVDRFKEIFPETAGVVCVVETKTINGTKVTIEPTELGLKVAVAAETTQDNLSYYYHEGVRCVDTRFAKKVVTPVTTKKYYAVLTVETTDFSVYQSAQFTFNNLPSSNPVPTKA